MRYNKQDVQEALKALGEALGLTVQPLTGGVSEPDSLHIREGGSGGYKIVKYTRPGGVIMPFYDEGYYSARELCQMIYFALKAGVENVHRKCRPKFGDLVYADGGFLQSVSNYKAIWSYEDLAWLVILENGNSFYVHRAFYLDSEAQKMLPVDHKRLAWKVVKHG